MPYKNKVESIMGKTRTLHITENCNLNCRYCYEKNKTLKTMSIDTAKKVINYFFEDIVKNKEDNIIWELIGGEPLLDVNLIKEIVDYILFNVDKYGLNVQKHFISLTTNGTLFTNTAKDFLTEYRKKINLSVSISLDGVRDIHNYNRNNSYDTIMKDFWWWRKNFPHNTIKATLNREALPYIFDSIRLFVDDFKLDYIFMNTVFENVWQENDSEIYYNQLIKTADFLLENYRYEDYFVSLFDKSLLHTSKEGMQIWCGCGNKMLAADSDGILYPCLRFKTTSNQPSWKCGDIVNGIDVNKLLPFKFYHNLNNNSKCLSCEYKSGCAWCPASCYDELGSIFQRTEFYCDMHIKRVEANRYFFNKIAKIEDKTLNEILNLG